MKKLLLFFILFVSAFGFINQVKADSDTTEIFVHYYRFDGDYTNWNLWTWQSEPTALEGQAIDFVTDTTSSEYNFGGVVAEISIPDTFPGITKMGLIVRKGNWEAKDIDSDRFITIPATSPGGQVHFYIVQGENAIGTSINDPNGPAKAPKFNYAYFTSVNTIKYNATENLAVNDISIFADNVEITPDNITVDGNSGTITLQSNIDFTKTYVVKAVFPSDSSENSYTVTLDGIYDTQAFEDQFSFDGALGAIVKNGKTTFRIWAPVSESVTLNLYSTGTPKKYGGTDTPIQQIPMMQGVKGTFYYVADSNLHGTYYTYSVTNSGVTHEVVDPYAKSTGVNGLRGLVVDFSQVNPAGFTYGDRPNNAPNYTDAIIYELHVRDITTSPTWNGTDANRGKYLGLIESGTTYEGVKTGFDHIKDLGITTVQLQPVFDFGVVDETKLNDPTYNSYNWGYMPLNYDTPEGSYSSNPYDGLTRVTELKQVIEGFANANIRVNMDVVYNHTGLTADSNFNLIVPGYYYRKNADGSYSNNSGTGNETASERYMMRKFIVDSTTFWASEYNISGFRFDLMALHDVETMNEVTTALHNIDPTIMVYGEPWTGSGSSILPADQVAGKDNLYKMPGVAAFNDTFRDGVKGTVFGATQGGYLQAAVNGKGFDDITISRVEYGIVGGTAYPTLNKSIAIWNTQPTKTINYVACHDNNTLYDKLYQTLDKFGKADLVPAMAKQAYSLVLTSQGIPFIYSGDEFLRSKPAVSGTGFVDNSYQSPDSVNEMRWNLLTTDDGKSMDNYVKGLIELRKEHPSFRMTNAQDVINNLQFLYTDKTGIIAYEIANTASGDTYKNILVINNANDKNTKLKLPANGGWVLLANADTAGTTSLGTYKGGSNVSVTAHSSYILYQDPTISDYNPVPAIIISAVGGVAVLVGAFMVYVFVIKKKAN